MSKKRPLLFLLHPKGLYRTRAYGALLVAVVIAAATVGYFGYVAPRFIDLSVKEVRNKWHNYSAQNEQLSVLLDTLTQSLQHTRTTLGSLQRKQRAIEEIETALDQPAQNTAATDSFFLSLSADSISDKTKREFCFVYSFVMNMLRESTLFDKLPVAAPCPGHEEISRNYGKYKDPFTDKIKPHYGVDFVAPSGEPVRVTAHGWVKSVTKSNRWGVRIVIVHDYRVVTVYAHLQNAMVSRGEYVKKGERIGSVGSSGFTIGPHLHYEIHVAGDAINPEELLFPRIQDIKKDTVITFGHS